MFASTTKDANTIKQSHFMFERSPYEKQITQNRQTVLWILSIKKDLLSYIPNIVLFIFFFFLILLY